MLLDHVEIRDTDNPTYDEIIETEEFELSETPADPRLDGLSRTTRGVIQDIFDGDVDEAIHYASARCNQYARPAAWAQELTGLSKGWRDFNRVRC